MNIYNSKTHLMQNLKFGLLGHEIVKQNVWTFNFEIHHAMIITYTKLYNFTNLKCFLWESGGMNANPVIWVTRSLG